MYHQPSSPKSPSRDASSKIGPADRSENHTDFGQFWTDFNSKPSATDHQPSASDNQPPNLWSRQPDEPAQDYQFFVTWLKLPVPRPSRKEAAAVLGCSRHRLGQLFVRHRWKVRTSAFDNHRTDAASRALDELLCQETNDWQERALNFRLQEWLLHEEMLESALKSLRNSKHTRCNNLNTLIRLMDLASVLGRRACGMPLDPADAPPAPKPPNLGFEEALRKVYGKASDKDDNRD